MAWGTDLESLRGCGRALVVLVAARDLPLGDETRVAVERALGRLRPQAERILLSAPEARIAGESRLALCVFSANGTLIARRHGALDEDLAMEWLGLAMAAARDESAQVTLASDDLPGRFERADRLLRLGANEGSEAEFSALAAEASLPWSARAHERLARLAIDRGDVALARERLARAAQEEISRGDRARISATEGSIRLAQRDPRAAVASINAAIQDLQLPEELDGARMELARALEACGETSCAIDTLTGLASSSLALSTRQTARRFAAALRDPQVSH